MAKSPHELAQFLPTDILERYEVRNCRSAAQILATTATTELADLVQALRAFSITVAEIRKPGGNESAMPRKLSTTLQPLGWVEARIKGDLSVKLITAKSLGRRGSPGEEDENALDHLDDAALKRRGLAVDRRIRKNFLDGHHVDHVKNRVAFDVEWNSKDQTFDRDLYAFRAFHECDIIDVAVILTRSADLNEVFDKLGPELGDDGKPRIDPKTKKPKLLKTKYGASTTWMGKLTYRLDAGRQGGCPVLALGITRRVISDWKG